jgi:hypothetical protein
MSKNPEATEVAVSRWWRKKDFGYQAIGAFKTGLAVVLCVWLGNLFGLPHSYWAAPSLIALRIRASASSLQYLQLSCRKTEV